jgi:Arc/MetJ-type ribon-helix-helix transcriptional regulator
MRIITINLPEPYLEAIQLLQDFGIYPSRSEAIRKALKDFLGDELIFFQDLEYDNLEKNLEVPTQ